MALELGDRLDWGELSPLRLKARTIADGIYTGGHRSPRKGSGVEFGGHRAYVPGDDLRWLDRRAMMRHGRLVVREFETETDRPLRLLVDSSRSMAYRGPKAPGAKLAYAAVLAAALARVALGGSDPISLDWLGSDQHRGLPSMGGREAFERLVSCLEEASASDELMENEAVVERAVAAVGRYRRQRSVVVLFSDLIDLPQETLDRFVSLANRGRMLIAVQVLDPAEAEFSFDGPLRLRASEGDVLVETDAAAAREGYLRALGELQRRWSERLLERGGRLVVCNSGEDPVDVIRAILRAAEGRTA